MMDQAKVNQKKMLPNGPQLIWGSNFRKEPGSNIFAQVENVLYSNSDTKNAPRPKSPPLPARQSPERERSPTRGLPVGRLLAQHESKPPQPASLPALKAVSPKNQAAKQQAGSGIAAPPKPGPEPKSPTPPPPPTKSPVANVWAQRMEKSKSACTAANTMAPTPAVTSKPVASFVVQKGTEASRATPPWARKTPSPTGDGERRGRTPSPVSGLPPSGAPRRSSPVYFLSSERRSPPFSSKRASPPPIAASLQAPSEVNPFLTEADRVPSFAPPPALCGTPLETPPSPSAFCPQASLPQPSHVDRCSPTSSKQRKMRSRSPPPAANRSASSAFQPAKFSSRSPPSSFSLLSGSTRVETAATSTTTTSTHAPGFGLSTAQRNLLVSFKTRLCTPFFFDNCSDGSNCTRVHSQDEFRRSPFEVSYASDLCPHIFPNGEAQQAGAVDPVACPNGKACLFAHNLTERNYHPSRFKMELCPEYSRGTCPRSQQVCFLAHGNNDLRGSRRFGSWGGVGGGGGGSRYWRRRERERQYEQAEFEPLFAACRSFNVEKATEIFHELLARATTNGGGTTTATTTRELFPNANGGSGSGVIERKHPGLPERVYDELIRAYGYKRKTMEIDEMVKLMEQHGMVRSRNMLITLIVAYGNANCGHKVIEKWTEFKSRHDELASQQQQQSDDSQASSRASSYSDLSLMDISTVATGPVFAGGSPGSGFRSSNPRQSFDFDPFVYTHVLSAMDKCNLSEEAYQVVKEVRADRRLLERCSAFLFDLMIRAACKSGKTYEALLIVRDMRSRGFMPERTGYAGIARCLCADGFLENAREVVQKEMLKAGMRPDARLYGELISAHSKSEDDLDSAFKLYQDMRRARIVPTLGICKDLLRECAKFQLTHRAVQLAQDLNEEGILPDTECLSLLVNACEGDPDRDAASARQRLALVTTSGSESPNGISGGDSALSSSSGSIGEINPAVDVPMAYGVTVGGSTISALKYDVVSVLEDVMKDLKIEFSLGLSHVHLSAASGTTQVAKKRIALCIGNSSYNFGYLKNPVNDATDLAEALRKVKFDVTLVVDASLPQIEKEVEAFVSKIDADTAALFFFSGHGYEFEEDNYLVPIADDGLMYEDIMAGVLEGFYSIQILREKLEAMHGLLNLIVLDCCRLPLPCDHIASRKVTKRVSVQTVIMHACSPNDQASDGAGRNGLFTKHLLRHITRPHDTLFSLFAKIREGVVQESNGAQQPWMQSLLSRTIKLFNDEEVEGEEESSVDTTCMSQSSCDGGPEQCTPITFPFSPLIDIPANVLEPDPSNPVHLSSSKECLLEDQPFAAKNMGWAGCRARRGVTLGSNWSLYWEAKILDSGPTQGRGSCRTSGIGRCGFAAEGAASNLGTDVLGFGFGGTGRKSFNNVFEDYGEGYGRGDTIGCLLDARTGCIGFAKNGKWLGHAFSNIASLPEVRGHLVGKQIFPAVASRSVGILCIFDKKKWSYPPRPSSAPPPLSPGPAL